MNGQGDGLEEVIQLVQALYSHSTPPHLQTSIQQRLQSIQSTSSIWSYISLLLTHSDSTVRFFAASTLQIKLQNSFDEVPSEQHEALKQDLLSWLSRSVSLSFPAGGIAEEVKGEKLVMRKLAGCMTVLSFKLEKWDDWLLEVVMRVSSTGARREGTLEVLKEVIEMVGRAELIGAKRVKYMSNLSSSNPHLVTTLASSLSSPSSSPTEINSALSCFTSYLLASQLSSSDLNQLYTFLLSHLSNPQTSVLACVAIEELVERSSGVSLSSGSQLRFITRKKVDELVIGWATSESVINVVRNATQEEEADEEAMAVMRLLCALTEYFISFLFSDAPSTHAGLSLLSPETSVLLNLILSITFFPVHSSESYNINEMTSGVWMGLQEESSDIGLVSGEGEGREGRLGREREWEIVKGIFGVLADGLRRRAQWPTIEVTREWIKDTFTSFKVYRSTALAETLLYSYYVLRESMLSGLVELAAQQVNRPSNESYEELEATLFSLFAIQEAVALPADPLNRLFGPVILPLLPSISSIQSISLRLIGAYSSWFSTQPESVLLAVTFVVGALEQKELCGEAAKSLRLLCDSSRKMLVSHVGSFVQVLGGLEGKVEDGELIKVLESVSSVVQALPVDEFVEPLLTLADPIINKLQSSIDAFAQLPTEARNLCLQQLSYLTACAKGLSDPEGDLIDLDSSFDDTQSQIDITAKIMGDPRISGMRDRLGRAIEGVTRIWSMDIEVVQALSDYIKHSTSDAIPSSIALDTFSLFSLSTSAVQASLSPVWLSIATSLLARLARDQNDFQMTDEDVARVGGPVEGALGAVLGIYTSVKVMDENPDVVQAFLGFCRAIVQHYPRIFTVIPNHLDAVVSFAERGLGMQERFSLTATINLLISIVQQTRMASPSATLFREILLPHTLSILQSLLLSIAGGVPRSHLTSLSELLHACILRIPEETRGGLKMLLGQEGWPSERATGEVKMKFERAVLSARTGKQAREAVSDFALVCRGLDGSAYGAASLSAFS